jgi:two-component sensor histidine kinase
MHAMAIIHEQFYEGEDMTSIDFALYLRRLLERMKSEFPEEAADMWADCEMGQALLNLEQAIPAGLIVEELLTNALKFAFPGKSKMGRVQITQRLLEGKMLQIEVRDEGAGLPPSIDPKRANTAGMMLIRLLAEQLDGDIEFRVEGGTIATLSFRMAATSIEQPPVGEGEALA